VGNRFRLTNKSKQHAHSNHTKAQQPCCCAGERAAADHVELVRAKNGLSTKQQIYDPTSIIEKLGVWMMRCAEWSMPGDPCEKNARRLCAMANQVPRTSDDNIHWQSVLLFEPS